MAINHDNAPSGTREPRLVRSDLNSNGLMIGGAVENPKTSQIPIIRSDVFLDHRDSLFAIGMIRNGEVTAPGCENEFYGARVLRGRVYQSKGFLRPDEVDENGAEFMDYDDTRSAQLVILQRTAVSSLARVVSNMRVVAKGENDRPLLIEASYPEIGTVGPKGVEISRFISRHEDGTLQNALKWPLFQAAVSHIEANELGPVYALLESKLAGSLMMQRVSVKSLGDEKYLPEINATKEPMEINIAALSQMISAMNGPKIELANGDFHYFSLGKQQDPQPTGIDDKKEAV
jgi:hypothetical protein